jgi:hypothetical protein
LLTSKFFKGISKEMFIDIINAYQNFVTLFFMMLNNRSSIVKIQNVVRIFKLFHNLNREFKIIPYAEFYNESLNNNEELKVIIIKNHLSKKKDKKYFDLMKYTWLFDSAFKRDLLSEKNFKKQQQEIFNSLNLGGGLNSIESILNMENSIHLIFQIRREHIIEDTMNIIADSQLNFRKPLKVVL